MFVLYFSWSCVWHFYWRLKNKLCGNIHPLSTSTTAYSHS